MQELWERYKTIVGAFLVPNKDMLCSEKFRLDDKTSAVWSKILTASNIEWSAFVLQQYKKRRAAIQQERERRNIPDNGPDRVKFEQSIMPLRRSSDIGLKAWNYLKSYARTDVTNAFYVPEVFHALDSTDRVDDDNYIISEKTLGLVSHSSSSQRLLTLILTFTLPLPLYDSEVIRKMPSDVKKAYGNKAKDRGNLDNDAVRFQSFVRIFGSHLHAYYDDLNNENVIQLTTLGLNALSDSNTQEGYSAMEQLPSSQPAMVIPQMQSSSSSSKTAATTPTKTTALSPSMPQMASPSTMPQMASPSAMQSSSSKSASVDTNKGQHT